MIVEIGTCAINCNYVVYVELTQTADKSKHVVDVHFTSGKYKFFHYETFNDAHRIKEKIYKAMKNETTDAVTIE